MRVCVGKRGVALGSRVSAFLLRTQQSQAGLLRHSEIRGVIIRDMSAELAMLIAEKQNLSGDVSSLQRAREHGTLVQCLCIYRRLFVRFPPLAAFSNHHERAWSCSFPRVTSFPCSLNLCQQKVMTYRMQREAFSRPDSCAQEGLPQCSRRWRRGPTCSPIHMWRASKNTRQVYPDGQTLWRFCSCPVSWVAAIPSTEWTAGC